MASESASPDDYMDMDAAGLGLPPPPSPPSDVPAGSAQETVGGTDVDHSTAALLVQDTPQHGVTASTVRALNDDDPPISLLHVIDHEKATEGPQLHDGPPGPPCFPRDSDDSFARKLENEVERELSIHRRDNTSTGAYVASAAAMGSSMDERVGEGGVSSRGIAPSTSLHTDTAKRVDGLERHSADPPGPPPCFPLEFDDSLSKRVENEFERNLSDHARINTSTVHSRMEPPVANAAAVGPSMVDHAEEGSVSSPGNGPPMSSHVEAATAAAGLDPPSVLSTFIAEAYMVEDSEETPGGGTVYEAELAILPVYQRKGFVSIMVVVTLIAIGVAVATGVLFSRNNSEGNTIPGQGRVAPQTPPSKDIPFTGQSEQVDGSKKSSLPPTSNSTDYASQFLDEHTDQASSDSPPMVPSLTIRPTSTSSESPSISAQHSLFNSPTSHSGIPSSRPSMVPSGSGRPPSDLSEQPSLSGLPSSQPSQSPSISSDPTVAVLSSPSISSAPLGQPSFRPSVSSVPSHHPSTVQPTNNPTNTDLPTGPPVVTLNTSLKLLAADGAEGDRFGRSTAIYQDTIIVGASGSAHVFFRSGEEFTHQAKLLAPNVTVNLGESVAIYEDTIVVGAPGVFSSAHVFVRSGEQWTHQAKLLAPDGAAGDYFGRSVAIYEDTIVVGAYGDDDNGDDSGSAHVFVRSGEEWNHRVKLLAPDGAAGDYFGRSVSVYEEVIVVGAVWDDDNGRSSGSAHVFARIGGGWTYQAKLLAPDGAEWDQFGWIVSIYEDTIVVSAHGDDDSSGSAHVFVRSGQEWNHQAKLRAPGGATDDRFC